MPLRMASGSALLLKIAPDRFESEYYKNNEKASPKQGRNGISRPFAGRQSTFDIPRIPHT